jgi:hypothetical protein
MSISEITEVTTVAHRDFGKCSYSYEMTQYHDVGDVETVVLKIYRHHFNTTSTVTIPRDILTQMVKDLRIV